MYVYIFQSGCVNVLLADCWALMDILGFIYA